MSATLEKSLNSLISRGIEHHLRNLQRGLEKESLRVSADGTLSQTDHPESLGSTLTHPLITTDYSESLLEFVTPVHNDIDSLLKDLYDIHHFTYQHVDDEKLWVNSMPCIVESEEKIPIAKYGTSNVAKMKEAYRRGLSHRYGSLMQAIAGIHFNFSMPDEFWADYFELSESSELQDKISAQYFALIRNFHKYSWMGIYLFSASPAVCRTFLKGREHNLADLESHSFYSPDATSLRLSDIGYSNDAQSDIEICYNSVSDFVKSLRLAIQTANPNYEKFGVNVDGVYQQLNPNLLQIENEFYSSIRPKRIAASGQSPSRALYEKGVQYIEVRSIDLNPFTPTGINAECIRYFDMFLLYCLFSESENLSHSDFKRSRENQQSIVLNGRNPKVKISTKSGKVLARDAMMIMLNEMRPIAELLDKINGSSDYISSLDAQVTKADNPDLTPSAQILSQMASENMSFYEFSMMKSENYEKLFKQTFLDPKINEKFEYLAIQSHEKQEEIENSDEISFDDFLTDYFQRQNAPI